MEKLSNKISGQANKLEELEIRLALIGELMTPYTLDNETKATIEKRYFMDNVLVKIVDGIDFIREDMANVRNELASISCNHRDD